MAHSKSMSYGQIAIRTERSKLGRLSLVALLLGVAGTPIHLRRSRSGCEKESEMTDFPDRKTQAPGYDFSNANESGNVPAWILGAIVAMAILGMLWYGVSGSTHVALTPDQPSIQQTAQPPAPATHPVEPATAKP
jgi:uncharacterized iron-regulated membrane protein